MPQTIGSGAVIRRGGDKLTAVELKALMDNQEDVDRIIKDIDDRRAVFLETEQATRKALDELRTKEKEVAKREKDLKRDHEKMIKDRAAAASLTDNEHQVLARRAKDVRHSEHRMVARAEELDGREKGIEHAARERENELRSREEQIEATEKVLEERGVEAVKLVAQAKERLDRVNTAAKMIKEAAGRL